MLKRNNLSRRKNVNILFRVALSFFLSTKSFAFLPDSLGVPPRIKSLLFSKALLQESVVRPELMYNPSSEYTLWKDRRSGAVRLVEYTVPRLLTDYRTGSDLAQTSRAVLKFIDQNADLLKMSSKNLKLKPSASILNQQFQFLKYDVYLNNILIKDANFDVRLVNGRVVQIVNQSFSEAQVSPQTYRTIDAENVMKEVLERPFVHSTTYYRVKESLNGYQLAPTRRIKSNYSSTESFDIEFDLSTGKMTEIFSDRFSVGIPVNIRGFERNAKEGLLDLPYSLGTLTSAKSGCMIQATPEGRVEDGTYRFDGLNSDLGNISSSDPKYKLSALAVKATAPNGTPYFTFPAYSLSSPPENDVFYAHGTVYHTLYKLRKITHSVDPDFSEWSKSPVKVFVNEDNECNAYYVRKEAGGANAGTINFQQGKVACNNTGNMADVVAHEWAHGLDDSTGGIEDRAYSEGFGDAVAFAVFFKPDIGTNLKRDNLPIRNISIFKSYPKDRGEFHEEGLIIANTFYDLYQNLIKTNSIEQSQKLFRSYVFQSIKGARKYTDVHDFLMAYEREKPLRCMINKVFIAHGLGRIRSECP
ncbi:MAG: hypothetical protein WCI18_05995 [Pseudomonadota bacterium]